MKVLLLDIETAPNRVYVWGLYNQNVALNQIHEPGYTLCWAAKWEGEDEVMFSSIREGKKKMLKGIHSLVDQADVIVHYNGTHFDMPTLNQEWMGVGLPPPAPYIQVDLLKTVRKRFRFPSNKLSYVAYELKLGEKIAHKGMDLWRECMSGDPVAWQTMEEYNKQDVKLLEGLYNKLTPWIVSPPNYNVFDAQDVSCCPHCGSDCIKKRGFAYTKTQVYRRYRCSSCGAWSRSRATLLPKEKRASVLVPI